MNKAPDIFGHRKFWAHKFGPAPVLPMSREEMDELGWDSCDIIIVTGDAYVDHPSFGMAIIGRLLEAQGFRVGIIAQPDWSSPEAFQVLGKPNLFFGIASGNMDSMVNHYTSDRKRRSDDAYTPDGVAGKRPDRATIVYSQRAREAYRGVPIIIGGIEASLRRIAQYDYWSEKVRRSILPDSKADLLIFGNAERAIVEVAHRLAGGEKIEDITDVRGTGFMRQGIPEGWTVIDSSHIDEPGSMEHHEPDPYLDTSAQASECEVKNSDAVTQAETVGAELIEALGEPSNALRQAQGERLESDAALRQAQGERLESDAALRQAQGERLESDAALRQAQGERLGGDAALRQAQGERINQAPKIVTFHSRPKKMDRETSVVRLPSYDQVLESKMLYAHASRVFHLETNPGNARAMVQRHGKRDVWLNPPPIPLTTMELDKVYELPYTRQPHPAYGKAKNPAYEMIRFSVNIMRGCFGGCTFCSITEHEGRIIQSRSENSIIREVETIRDSVPGFTGNISDLGGPTANMYRLACKSKKIESSCRRLSCVYPGICDNLVTSHKALTKLYRRTRALPGIKRVFIASGLRYDLAVKDPEYVKELVTHHVGGYLKIAPEHTEQGPLSKMMKPGIGAYDRFKELFDKYSKEAGKEQYLIPYFISAHPGTTDEDMVQLALWLKRNDFRLDQVQAFLPTPMAMASTMYHTGKNPLKKLGSDSETVDTVRDPQTRRLHKALLRYHDAENWPIIRKALNRMGRNDLIGSGKNQLVPNWQPEGTGHRGKKGAPKREEKDLHHRIPVNKKGRGKAKPTANRRSR